MEAVCQLGQPGKNQHGYGEGATVQDGGGEQGQVDPKSGTNLRQITRYLPGEAASGSPLAKLSMRD